MRVLVLCLVLGVSAARTAAGQTPRIAIAVRASYQVAYLAGLSKDDWRRVGRHSTLGEMDVARQLSEFHVGHAEQHLDQLDGLAAAEGSPAR